MFFNYKIKCKKFHVGNKDINATYVMNDQGQPVSLEQVAAEKDLGVYIDSKLTFRDHITKKVNIANRNLGAIIRSFTYIDKTTFLQLFKSLVRPHLEYGSSIWYPIFKKDKIQIENIQRRATRLVNSLQGKSYSERLRSLGLPSLEYRRLTNDIVQVFKIIGDIDNIDKN